MILGLAALQSINTILKLDELSQYVNKDNKIGAIIEFIEIMLVLKETKIFIFSANFNLISTKTTKFYLEIKFF